jgi:NMD protein affecting ribosome stability and mRNA decay
MMCASCGCELEPDSAGLCEECEEKIMAADTAWKPKEEA